MHADDVTFDLADPVGEEARWCVAQYVAELDALFPAGFEVGDTTATDAVAYAVPLGRFVVLHLRGRPVGCGAITTIDEGVGEVKRMWIAPEVRGTGLGRRLLAHLEALAAEHGHHTVRLDTNPVLTSAMALYEAAGYVEVGRYNDNPYAGRFYEKRLGRAPG